MKDVTIDITPKWWTRMFRTKEEANGATRAFILITRRWHVAGDRFAAAMGNAWGFQVLGDSITAHIRPDHGLELVAFRDAFLDRLNSPDVEKLVRGAMAASAAAGPTGVSWYEEEANIWSMTIPELAEYVMRQAGSGVEAQAQPT